MTALVPYQHFSFGYTTSDRPTLWVYNPFNFNENSARFEVDNAQQEEIEDYETYVVGALDEPGVISLPFPDVPPLSIGETYHWHFLVYCGNVAYEGRPLTVRGSIRRVAPGEVPDNQIWYDRLTEVGTALRNDPSNSALADQWTDLMKHVAVGGIYDRLSDFDTALRNDPTNPELIRQWDDIMGYVGEENSDIYDRLSDFGTALRDDPTNPALVNQWSELMRAVEEEIDAIAEQPLQECCTLERPQSP